MYLLTEGDRNPVAVFDNYESAHRYAALTKLKKPTRVVNLERNPIPKENMV